MSTKILAVDDSCSMRSMVRGALEAAGHEVHEAGGGEEALQYLATGTVDLVISDLYMPGMDGLALLAQIRGMRQHRFTPVLVLTTENAEEMKQRGRAAGATGWLVKPFQPEQLRDVVARVLGAARVRA
ncbi:MAG: response regulator [Candidatus Rokubacteria bacterium]|nr:response regulator [Candidatus Rokubacteria bacterium]